MPLQTADVLVVGAGPAGSVMAARLALLGYSVCIVEAAKFPRAHLGESLTPGISELLGCIGARGVLEKASSLRAQTIRVKWESAPYDRTNLAGQGFLVDRGEFDRLLLEHAAALGVRIFQPASATEMVHSDEDWRVRVRMPEAEIQLRVPFLVDASGRSGLLLRKRRPTGPPTLAIYAYWRGSQAPVGPIIEAGPEAWFWGVPLPDGSYNALAFVDPPTVRRDADSSLEKKFRQLLGASEVMRGWVDAEIVGKVRVCNATPFLDENCVTHDSIKVGDAALSIDPLSSSGVQHAIKTSLSGAIVINTLLRKPESSACAVAFYSESLRQTSDRHREWAASLYQLVAAKSPVPFWLSRAATARVSVPRRFADLDLDMPLRLSPDVEFVQAPCIVGDFVVDRSAILHPMLSEKIAFLENHELAPLLKRVKPGSRRKELVNAWSDRMPAQTALRIAEWLISRGILLGCEAA